MVSDMIKSYIASILIMVATFLMVMMVFKISMSDGEIVILSYVIFLSSMIYTKDIKWK